MGMTRQGGAVMLAVMIISAILAVSLSYATIAINQRLELAEQSKLKFREKAYLHGKINEIAYLIATQRITAAGVSRGINQSRLSKDDDGLWLYALVGDEIRTDGYVYEASGVQFSIQNEAGLIPINSANQYWLQRWLHAQKFKAAEKSQLLAVLADYLDGDDSQRAGGREDSQSSPGNFLAQSCEELQRIQEWKKVFTQHPDFTQYCSLSRNPALNLNSVPEILWRILWPNSVEQIFAARNRGEWITQDNPITLFEPAMINVREDVQRRMGGTTFIVRVWGGYSSVVFRVSPRAGGALSYVLRTRI